MKPAKSPSKSEVWKKFSSKGWPTQSIKTTNHRWQADKRNIYTRKKYDRDGYGTHQADGLALHLPRLLRGRGHRQTVPGSRVVRPLAELAQSSKEQEGVLVFDGREGLHRRRLPLSPVVATQCAPGCRRGRRCRPRPGHRSSEGDRPDRPQHTTKTCEQIVLQNERAHRARNE